MADRIHRVTLFKIPKPEDQQTMLELYRKVEATNRKGGKPYILSLTAGSAEVDQRAQGYTVVAKTEFASVGDMEYFDNDCDAHKALKAVGRGTLTIDGILTVFFKPRVMGGSDP
ncbi:hypothetical protein HIM_11606 [Hirsutella minnesotensis 3608]|uniref:Stress-response A/B barrel domain-containing protein n=1 Tax=Hirsutella minnesotensis 3608 TaxID=1043627 RepID=A0A0F8A0Z3_9HYPO|nr:hypothetical protein HIM_11606 [Hirsutella minnesotensis 3608]